MYCETCKFAAYCNEKCRQMDQKHHSGKLCESFLAMGTFLKTPEREKYSRFVTSSMESISDNNLEDFKFLLLKSFENDNEHPYYLKLLPYTIVRNKEQPIDEILREFKQLDAKWKKITENPSHKHHWILQNDICTMEAYINMYELYLQILLHEEKADPRGILNVYESLTPVLKRVKSPDYYETVLKMGDHFFGIQRDDGQMFLRLQTQERLKFIDEHYIDAFHYFMNSPEYSDGPEAKKIDMFIHLHVNLGYIHYFMKQFVEAEHLFDEALKYIRNPKHEYNGQSILEILRFIQFLKFNMGKAHEAQKFVEEEIKYRLDHGFDVKEMNMREYDTTQDFPIHTCKSKPCKLVCGYCFKFSMQNKLCCGACLDAFYCNQTVGLQIRIFSIINNQPYLKSVKGIIGNIIKTFVKGKRADVDDVSPHCAILSG